MKPCGRELVSVVGLASLFASVPVWASNSVSFMLLGSAQQAVAESGDLVKPATPAPESVRSFESLRAQPLSKAADEEKETRYSVFGFRSAQNSFFLPLYKEQMQTRKDKYQLLDGWGVGHHGGKLLHLGVFGHRFLDIRVRLPEQSFLSFWIWHGNTFCGTVLIYC